MKKTNREVLRETNKKNQSQKRVIQIGGWSLAIIAAIAVIFLVVSKYGNSDGLMGTAVAIPSRDHLPDGTLPGPYNSNPPAGGSHYATNFTSKFYQESDLAALPKYPQGYLVHSLEHGYVIFWYNCQVPNTDCSALKKTIQSVMDETGGTKLIAFPWSDMNVPLAMTSWGRILEFQNPDPAVMKQFVLRNRNQAPEPNAD